MRRHMQRLQPVLTSLTAALFTTALLQRSQASAEPSRHDPFEGLEPDALGEALMTAAVAAAPSDDQPGLVVGTGPPPGLLKAAAMRCGLAAAVATSLQQVKAHCANVPVWEEGGCVHVCMYCWLPQGTGTWGEVGILLVQATAVSCGLATSIQQVKPSSC